MVLLASCGGGERRVPFEEVNLYGLDRDTMIYGFCSSGSAMNTLQIITDADDTITLNLATARDNNMVLGGYAVGDEIAVAVNADTTEATMVVNKSALNGNWIMSNPLDGSSEMGIRIKEGGIAESIDQPSLAYRSWKLFNGQLEIVAIREGGGDEVETNLYDIVAIGPDTLIYKNDEDLFEYSRYKHVEHKDIIQLEDTSEEDFSI